MVMHLAALLDSVLMFAVAWSADSQSCYQKGKGDLGEEFYWLVTLSIMQIVLVFASGYGRHYWGYIDDDLVVQDQNEGHHFLYE